MLRRHTPYLPLLPPFSRCYADATMLIFAATACRRRVNAYAIRVAADAVEYAH